MIECTYLSREVVDYIFNERNGHIPLRLARLPDARLLWLNRRVMVRDPQFAALGSEEAYAQHIITQCAYALPEEGDPRPISAELADAFADRYGGKGIGRNGGSGRAAFVNGYHVKGIGRTPLVSVLADRAHASGGAYLEECVRETIFAEIADLEFPFGAVPVLAIIDTGAVQVWRTENGPKPERRCLLVRPAFLRPAHFMRATEFISANPKEGSLDNHRVAKTSAAVCELFGREQLAETWRSFWLRWAEQLAHGYVHRLNHGGNSESNIALDGRLLDFGGMTALPTWGEARIMDGTPPAGMDMAFLIEALQAATPMLSRHVDHTITIPQMLHEGVTKAISQYKYRRNFEVLVIIGLTDDQARSVLNSSIVRVVGDAIHRLIANFAREKYCIFDGVPATKLKWDLSEFWESNHFHLRELRLILAAAIEDGALGDEIPASVIAELRRRCHILTATRGELYRDSIKRDIYLSLDGGRDSEELNATDVDRIIEKYLHSAVRRCKVAEGTTASLGAF